MKISSFLQVQFTLKIILASLFVIVLFLCSQCVSEKPVVQRMPKSTSPQEKNIEKIPPFKTENPTESKGDVVTEFPATLSTIPLEQSPDTFSPDKFSTVIYPTSLNKRLGFYLPNWIVTMQTDLSKVYRKKRILLRGRGIFGSVDWREHNVEGPEWNRTVDPNTGRPFPNNFNTVKSVNLNTFSSTLPIEKRLIGGTVELNGWDTKSENDLAELGRNFARGTEFGDFYIKGKQRTGLLNMDWENNYENGGNPRKALRYIKSVCDNLEGIFQAAYVFPLVHDLGYLSPNGYPDANGTVNPKFINPIYTKKENLDGVNYGVVDSDNFAPVLEISHYGETSMHGFNDGIRTYNAYGNNANIEHYLARVTSMAEKNYSYLHSINKDLCFIMAKLICDRGPGWQYPNGNTRGTSKRGVISAYLTRDQAFKSVVAVFFSGLHLHEWNRALPNLNADCYNGFQAALNLLGTRKQFSENDKISAVDMRTDKAEFHLWKSKYKFVGEKNYRQEEGYKLKDNPDNLLVRTMRLGNRLAIVILNPYNVATKFDLTVACTSGGMLIEKNFTEGDWKSCYPNEARKDYIFDIIEMK